MKVLCHYEYTLQANNTTKNMLQSVHITYSKGHCSASLADQLRPADFSACRRWLQMTCGSGNAKPCKHPQKNPILPYKRPSSPKNSFISSQKPQKSLQSPDRAREPLKTKTANPMYYSQLGSPTVESNVIQNVGTLLPKPKPHPKPLNPQNPRNPKKPEKPQIPKPLNRTATVPIHALRGPRRRWRACRPAASEGTRSRPRGSGRPPEPGRTPWCLVGNEGIGGLYPLRDYVGCLIPSFPTIRTSQRKASGL